MLLYDGLRLRSLGRQGYLLEYSKLPTPRHPAGAEPRPWNVASMDRPFRPAPAHGSRSQVPKAMALDRIVQPSTFRGLGAAKRRRVFVLCARPVLVRGGAAAAKTWRTAVADERRLRVRLPNSTRFRTVRDQQNDGLRRLQSDCLLETMGFSACRKDRPSAPATVQRCAAPPSLEALSIASSRRRTSIEPVLGGRSLHTGCARNHPRDATLRVSARPSEQSKLP